MNFFLGLIGVAGACALIGASFAYVFATAETQRFLKTAVAAAGLVFFVLVAVCDLAHAAGLFGFILLVLAISPVAYLVRAHRRRQPERPPRLRGVERTPVMPRHIPGDDL